VEAAAAPGSDPWAVLPWEQHEEARRAVAENPEGMTLELIGSWMGVTRERVRQIEVSALAKLRTESGADTGEHDGVVFAIIDCRRCGEPYARLGNAVYCELCESKRRRR